MSYALRTLGTAATFFPNLKRATGWNSAGFTVLFVPDTNLATADGADQTGTGKFYLYQSSDANRSSWSIGVTTTPTQAGMTSSKQFIGSMTMTEDNDVYLAYLGTDNSLRMLFWNWNGTTYDAATSSTVVAANAVTDRYRAIDISVNRDVANASPAIIVYESSASAGPGAYVRVYVRNSDGTTWRKAYETQIMTTQFVRAGSEDVSVSWGASGTNSNVGHLAIYFTNTNTAADNGDTLRELSYNVSTGTDGSATVVRTWVSDLSKNVASGSRRGWLYQHTYENTEDDVWVFGGIVGSGSPYYTSMRLRHTTSTYVQNKTTNVPSEVTARKFGIVTTSRPSWATQTSTYEDNRLVFAYVGAGVAYYANTMRAVVFRYDDTDSANDTVVSIDYNARILDNNYSIGDGPLAIYGGINKRNTGTFEYTFLAMYGAAGSTVSTTPLVATRYARAIIEDTFPAPSIVQPALASVAKDRPDFQVQSLPSGLYQFGRGKLQIQAALDAGYSTDLRQLEETDADFRVYQSVNGLSASYYFITYTPSVADQFHTQTWYWRARIKDDLGGYSAWAESLFVITHPPAALPTGPSDSASIVYASGDVTFTWSFSDHEPTDGQTAYQIVLTRTDTNATVTDTGKVSSSVTSATITISSALRDIPLAYQITVWDTDDSPGAASNPVRFTVSDPPVVVITSPADGATVTTGVPTISWTFTANGRTQSYYRIVVTNTDLSPDEDIADTGWIAGSDTSYTFPAQILQNSTNYKVLVYVRDSVGLQANSESNLLGNSGFERTASGWTATSCTIARSTAHVHDGSYALEMTPSAACNIVSVTYPATVSHQYTAYAWVYSGSGWTSVTVSINWRTSGDADISTSTTTVAVAGATWTLIAVTATAPATTAGARVKIAMTGSPTASDKLYVDDVVLAHTSVDFSTTWTPPTAGDIALTSDVYKVTISWTNVNLDSDFVSWRVYRKYNKAASTALDVDDTANTWVMIYETSDVASSYQYRDYFAPMGKLISYIVVQVVDRFGSVIESNIPTPATVTMSGDRYYFVPAVPIGSIASFEASNVTADSFTREIETETLHVIGRGRQVQIGDDLGYDGSYTIALRNPDTARSDREFIELLCAGTGGGVFVRSPFGDVLFVNFSSPQFDRMAGVGQSDLGDLTVPYVQVFEEVTITRTV
jgi:hypothetical protein